MTISTPFADVAGHTITYGPRTYTVQALESDHFTILLAGVPVGRILYTFGAAHGVPEGDAVTEEALTAMADVWFAAIEA